MNGVYISGFAKYISRKGTVTSFKLSVSRGNRGKDGQKRFLIPVKAFGDVPGLAENSFISVAGELDSHKYNEREVVEILCNPANVLVSGLSNVDQFPPGYPLPFGDERGFEPVSNVPF